jgi:hypothetical protein
VTDNFSYKGNVNPYTGAVGTNRYIHDKTSPYYQGPDSHGRVGHSGAPFQGQGYGSSNSLRLDPEGFDPETKGRTIDGVVRLLGHMSAYGLRRHQLAP